MVVIGQTWFSLAVPDGCRKDRPIRTQWQTISLEIRTTASEPPRYAASLKVQSTSFNFRRVGHSRQRQTGR